MHFEALFQAFTYYKLSAKSNQLETILFATFL